MQRIGGVRSGRKTRKKDVFAQRKTRAEIMTYNTGEGKRLSFKLKEEGAEGERLILADRVCSEVHVLGFSEENLSNTIEYDRGKTVIRRGGQYGRRSVIKGRGAVDVVGKFGQGGTRHNQVKECLGSALKGKAV